MPLQSQLLRGDPKLEAATVSDPAHIVPGAAGEHVRKIQQALIQLDGATIAPDGAYGPATAAAVLAYKTRRSIVNPAYQKSADNIVGRMTMAALDREMVGHEALANMPARIVPVHPIGRVERRNAVAAGRVRPMLGFKIGAFAGLESLPHLLPNGPTLTIELRENELGSFQVVFGKGGTVRCADPSVGIVSDPAQPNAHGGTMRVTKDAHLFRVRGRSAGSTFIEFVGGSTPARFGPAERLALKVTNPRTGGPWVAPDGTPLKPKGTGRKINLFGQGETDALGFEDYSSDQKHRDYAKNGKIVTRPWTGDPTRPPGVADDQASDVAIRSVPIVNGKNDIVPEIQRMAMPGCRVTFAGPGPTYGPQTLAQTDANIKELLRNFPDAIVIEESTVGDGHFKAIVFEIP